MCIRALDYLPPVDVRFGEFLRAIITADNDLVPDDPHNYRLAFAEAFRARGILAEDCLSMSPENLLWETPEQMFGSNSLSIDDLHSINLDLVPHYKREKIFESSEANRKTVWDWLMKADQDVSVDLAWENALGIYFKFREDTPRSIFSKEVLPSKEVCPNVEVHSVRTTRRAGPDGQDLRQLVIEVTQRRRGYFDLEQQKRVDAGEEEPATPDFIFRGGATLIIDLKEEQLRYVIRKPITDDTRLDEQRKTLSNPEGFGFTYHPDESGEREPFAMIHRGQ